MALVRILLLLSLSLPAQVFSQVVFTGRILDLRSHKAFGKDGQNWIFRPGDSPVVGRKQILTSGEEEEDPEWEATPQLEFAYASQDLILDKKWIQDFPIQVSIDKAKGENGKLYFPDFAKFFEETKGYSWYRTEVMISSEDFRTKFRSRVLTIRLGLVGQADAVYWNGKFIGGTGLNFDSVPEAPIDDKLLSPDKIRFYRIPINSVFVDKPNILAVRVYSKLPIYPGLAQDKFYISSLRYAERAEYWNDFKKIFVIILTVLLGVFYLYWQFLFREEDRATIFYSLASFFMAINTLFQSQIIYSIVSNGILIKKIECLSWIALVHFLFNFIVQFSRVQFKYIKRANQLVDALGAIAFIGFLFLPDLHSLQKAFHYWSFITILLSLGLVYVIFLGRKTPAMGSVSFGLGGMALLLFQDVLVGLQLDWYPLETYFKDYAFAGFTVSVALSIISNMVKSKKLVEKQKEEKDRLSRYFSPEVMETIVNEEIKMGGEERPIATLFSDIVGFTTFAEKNPPGVVLENLNQIFENLSDLIFHYSATLDKYIGDAIMAFWGAPKQSPLDAYNAVACAFEMQKKMIEINQKLGLPPGTFKLRIGVNFGNAIVGNIGSLKRMDYTVIGDAVNTAARLESSGVPGRVVVSESAFQAAGGSEFIEFDETKDLVLKGKSEPVKVYFVTGVKPRSLN